MNSGPLTRAGYSERASAAVILKNASTGFEAPLKTMVKAMGARGETVSAIDQPFDEAIAFFRQKVSTPTKSWTDVWDAAHSKMFMVAGASTTAIVDDFKGAIAKALEQGTTLEDFRKDFDTIVKKHGWSYRGERGWRTRTIFETNLRTAYAAGRYAQMTEPDTLATFPYWQYHHSGAVHPRLQHKAWDAKCYAADDPFWKVAYPPNGFGCGCFVTPVSRPGLRRLGKSAPDRAPDLDQLGTDQPLGVDPSFAYNPGADWLEHAAPGRKAVTADEVNAAVFMRSAERGKWPDGSWTPVGVAYDKVAEQLGVNKATELRLLAETVRSLEISFIESQDYALIPRQLMRGGKVTSKRKGSYSVSKVIDGVAWSADVSVIRDGDRRRLHLDRLQRSE